MKTWRWLPAAALALALVVPGWSADPPPAPVDEDTAAEEGQGGGNPGTAQPTTPDRAPAPEIFVPSETISGDSTVSFPVDI